MESSQSDGDALFTPPSAVEPVEAVVNTVFEAARRGQLVLCAGAGLSRAGPADLPSGARLGKLLDERLRALVSGYSSPPNPENLIAVADAGADLDGGKTALRSEVLGLAEFLEAEPNYGHQAVAELLCEGAIGLLLLWNWDDCVERVDVTPERLQVARSGRDIEDLDQPSIAKIHGCATRRSTLLITSTDLAAPPYWTDAAFGERLRGKTAVFIGIGDIADYAQRRLEQLRDELAQDAEHSGHPLDIWVISPTIRSQWEDSEWAKLVPDLPEERRVELTADDFLDQLARRWVREPLDDLETSASAVRPEVADALRTISAGLSAIGAARVLRWCRRAALGQKIGLPVMFCDGLQQLLMAFAVLLSETGDQNVVFRGPAALEIGERRIEALVACRPVPADRVRQRARRRAAELADQGTIDGKATFLVSGVVWGPLNDDVDADLDMTVGQTDPEDVVVGSSAVSLAFLDASEMARAA
jgi:hypothetical protein